MQAQTNTDSSDWNLVVQHDTVRSFLSYRSGMNILYVGEIVRDRGEIVCCRNSRIETRYSGGLVPGPHSGCGVHCD